MFCRKNVAYHRSAALSLAELLNAFPECCAYDMVAETLLELAILERLKPDEKEDPIMQARVVSCLAAAWPRTPDESLEIGADAIMAHREAVINIQRTHAASLARALCRAVGRKVWSVRVPIFHALAAIVSRSFVNSSIPTIGGGQAAKGSVKGVSVLSGSLLADVVEVVEIGAGDAKYSQV